MFIVIRKLLEKNVFNHEEYFSSSKTVILTNKASFQNISKIFQN